MKLLRLLKYSFSRYFVKELFLVLQLTLMLWLTFSILSPVDNFVEMYHGLDTMYSFDFTETAFFNPNVAAYQTAEMDSVSIRNQIDSYLSKLSDDPEIDRVMRLSYNTTQIHTGRTKQDPRTGAVVDEVLSAYFLVYGDGYAGVPNINMLDGSFAADKSDGCVPVAVSKSLSRFLPIGTRYPFNLSGTGQAVTCVVTGVLTDDAIIPSTYGFSDFPSLSSIGTRISDVGGAHFIIAMADESTFPNLDWEYSCFISVQKGIRMEDVCNRINQETGAIGTCYTVSKMVGDSMLALLRGNRELILECVLLSLIAVFGYGGYLYLSICRRQKNLSVLYILGLTRTQSLILDTFSGVLILFVSFLIAYFTYPSIQEILGISRQDSLGIVSITFCVLFFSFILLSSYIAAFCQFHKATTISLYQGGD